MAKYLAKKLPAHFWNEESGLTSMFILLCISNFVVTPFLPQRTGIMLLIRLFWFALLVTGITTLSKSKSQARLFSVIPVLLVVVSVLRVIFGGDFLSLIGLFIEISVFTLLIGMVLVKVFEDGPVTVHRVIGSIVIYILLADVWAIVYEYVYVHIPGSLIVPDAMSESGIPSSIFLYFSFTTLTTTGYGDILPAHTITRTLVIVEQLVGVLYPVVLIGRLVSLVSGNTKKDTDAGK